MQEDNAYPNDSTFFWASEPEEQKIARKKETAQTLEAISVLQELVDRLNERITFYNSNTTIPDDVRTDPTKFLILHNCYTLVAKTLFSEKEYIEDLISSHKRWFAFWSPQNGGPPHLDGQNGEQLSRSVSG